MIFPNEIGQLFRTYICGGTQAREDQAMDKANKTKANDLKTGMDHRRSTRVKRLTSSNSVLSNDSTLASIMGRSITGLGLELPAPDSGFWSALDSIVELYVVKLSTRLHQQQQAHRDPPIPGTRAYNMPKGDAYMKQHLLSQMAKLEQLVEQADMRIPYTVKNGQKTQTRSASIDLAVILNNRSTPFKPETAKQLTSYVSQRMGATGSCYGVSKASSNANVAAHPIATRGALYDAMYSVADVDGRTFGNKRS